VRLLRGLRGGCQPTANNAGLAYKGIGMETGPVKAMVRAFREMVRQEVTGAAIPEARP
jgi:urease accessory protein